MIRRLADRVRALLEVLARLGPGSHALVLRLVEKAGWGYVLGGCAVALYSAARYPQYVAWGVVAWCALAWAHAPEEKDEEQPAEGEPDAAEEAPPAPAPAPAERPPVTPTALLEAVRDIGTPHAQLKPLADHLRTTTEAVRTAAAGAGWPVKDVRMQGRSASAGLRGDEAPPSLTTPPPPVVGAGQPADDDTDDTTDGDPREGFRVVRSDSGLTVYDHADTHRRHDLRKT
ncbi:hypothetical protein [Streptomyces sp. NPDC016845]|uniref:hypothetical protein n=1 Tax=Streptomyces sp. NPDC016845 TaxID=3364972 RepID=UPI0037AC1574